MEYGFLSRAGKFLQEQKKHRRWMMGFLCLAGGVVLGTLTFLKLYGQAMTHQVKVLDCQYEVHEHTDDCYEEDEDGGKTLVCGYADYVIHVHNDDCYDQRGVLVCPLEEHEPHEHTEECYEEERILICGEEESEAESGAETEASAAAETAPEAEPSAPEPAAVAETVRTCGKEEHTHTDSCYPEACPLNEHTHGDGCYTETLTCTGEEHTHDDGCYDEEGTLICSKEEHTHDGGCYESALACTEEEHTHSEACSPGGPVCGMEEHTHTDDCYTEQTVETETAAEAPVEPAEAPAAEETPAEEGHTHTDDCYEVKRHLVCGEQEAHIHDDSCYSGDCFDEDGNLIEGSRPSCGLLQLEERIHTEDCFRTVELTAEEVAALNQGAALHVHEDSCYDEDGALICGHEATHIHGLDCYDDDGTLICGSAGSGEQEHGADGYEETKFCQGSGYLITAGYNSDANLPEETELLAEEILPDMDETYYTDREAEYREAAGNEEASMRNLLKIGFYVEEDGERIEVKPETPVEITVEFLDEDRLPEGSRDMAVLFEEDKTERLEGGTAIDRRASFRMERSLEIGIGSVPEEEHGKLTEGADGTMRLHLADTFEYEDDTFQITFRVEGEALLPEDTADKPEAEASGSGDGSADTVSGPAPEETEDSADPGTSDDSEEGIPAEPAQ